MNTEAIQTLVAKWSEPGGIPFKGKLISDDGCMCAQGQALHYVGGWDADRLRGAGQAEADQETAKLLGISIAHAILLRRINDGQPGAPSVVLTNPEQVLGDQAHIVLAFWRHLDRMTPTQRAAAGAASGYAARVAAAAADWAAAEVDDWAAAEAADWAAAGAGAAAEAAAEAAAWAAAGAAAEGACWDNAEAAAGATNEIQGAAVMRARKQAFYFLPLFGFADPEAVLADDMRETTL